jgi:two-component system nitrogen regulation sensor histidine kinase GlnL
VDVAASPLFGEGAQPDGVLLVLRDRSMERRLEQLESERERFEAFGRIAAGLAHEIKNPLGGIRGAGELLAARASDAKTRETAELVVHEAARITRLVDELGVFARGDELRLAPVNVHRVLDGVLALVSHEPLAAGVKVVRAFDPSIPELLADADRLTQVFLNLLRNALQAMGPAGGTLTVTTRMTLDHRIALEEGKPLPTLAVWIEDTGRGMDAEELRQATTPFYTTRAGGTGLGLALAEYWVARHLGSLHLESEKGAGTRVRIALPVRREP